MFTGSMVALVTPMLDDGAIDLEALDGLVEFHVQNGTSAIVAVGTTGESATLGVDEHITVLKRVIDVADGAISVIAGTGANSTSEAIHLTSEAAKAGADACLLVTPYYNKPTQEGLFRHYRAIAEAVDVAQILYNVPGRTACDMLPETVERLSRVDNIVGIKEATGDMERAQQVIDACGVQFDVYSGDDPTAVELILLGGRGNISVTANVAPRKMADACAAALAGEGESARLIDAGLRDLHAALFVESSPIPVKWALAEMGMIGAGIRLPLTPLNESYHETVRTVLQSSGLLI